MCRGEGFPLPIGDPRWTPQFHPATITPLATTPPALHPASQTLASASIAALAGILLVVGFTYLRKCLLMHQ